MTHRLPAAILDSRPRRARRLHGRDRPRAADPAPAAEVVGEPINCIQTRQIRSSSVHDDFTIDFDMLGGQVLRNTLPNSCPGLGFERRFAHSSTTGTLCNVDTVTVLDSNGRRLATCGLGQFVPIRYTPAGS